MMKTDRKPPLPRSPIRLRSRRRLQSDSNPIQTPPPAPGTQLKSKKNLWDSEIRPEYHTISFELRALAEKVKEVSTGFVNVDCKSSLFERGRLYDEYSARRNERLRKKKEAAAGEQKKSSSYGLGVRVEKSASASASVAAASRRKKEFSKVSILSTPMATMNDAPAAPRYSLRSNSANKENVVKPSFLKSRSTRIGSKTACRF